MSRQREGRGGLRTLQSRFAVARPSISGGNLQDQDLRRFLRADPEALSRVGNLVAKILASRGYYIPHGERQDLQQETILQLWRVVSHTGFELTGRFEAFVRTLTHRRCVDWIRRRRPEDPIDEDFPDATQDQDQRVYARERILLGRQVVDEIRSSCQELFHLHAGSGLTYREIARRQRRSEVAIRVQMSKCLKEARKILQRIHIRRASRSRRTQ